MGPSAFVKGIRAAARRTTVDIGRGGYSSRIR